MDDDLIGVVLEEACDPDAARDYARRRDAEHRASEPRLTPEEIRRERCKHGRDRVAHLERLAAQREARMDDEDAEDLDLRTTQEIVEHEELRERIGAPLRRQAEALRGHITDEERRATFAAVVPGSVPAVLASRYRVAPCTRSRGAGRPRGAPARATSAGGRSDPAEPEPGEPARRPSDDEIDQPGSWQVPE